MKALVFEGKVTELAENEFPVSPEMEWIEVDKDVKTGDVHNDGVFKTPEPIVIDKTAEERLAELDMEFSRFDEDVAKKTQVKLFGRNAAVVKEKETLRNSLTAK